MERIFLKYILCLLCVYTITACDKVNDEVPDQPKFTPYVSESYWSVKTEVYVDAPFNAEKIKKELEDNPPALPSDVYYFYMRKLSSALSAERTVSLLNSAREEQWKAYIETTSSIEWSEKYSFIKTDQKTLPSYEHWTFHLMTDKKDTIYNPQIQISVVSGTKRSIFRQKNKTKRSKKRLHTTLIKPEQKVNEDLCSGFIVS